MSRPQRKAQAPTKQDRAVRRANRRSTNIEPAANDSATPYERPHTPRLEPANQRQRTALAYLRERRPVVVLRGSAGTGKSMLATYHAACLMNSRQIEKIYLVRPAVAAGKTVGLLKGTLEEKLAPYFAQTIAHLTHFLGGGFTKYLLEKKQIEMFAVEYLRGMSFENCVVIFEETQNFTAEEFEMVLSRLGKNCQFIFTGDERQHDLKGVSGLSSTINLLQNVIEQQPNYLSDEDLDHLSDGIAVVTFEPEDCVRSGLTRAFVKIYYNEGK
jgi:phosphate starvation-inducible PhoH-like protein